MLLHGIAVLGAIAPLRAQDSKPNILLIVSDDHGYDVMEHCFPYHCNAHTYGDPTWFPDMGPKLRELLEKGVISIPLPTGN